jgi:hypothetical protein
MIYCYNNGILEGFYRTGKTIDIGDNFTDSVTTFNFGSSEYKHKGMVIEPIFNIDAVIRLKFWDPTGSKGTGVDAEYAVLTVPWKEGAGVTAGDPFLIPARVAEMKITNPPTTPGYSVRVTLIN